MLDVNRKAVLQLCAVGLTASSSVECFTHNCEVVVRATRLPKQCVEEEGSALQDTSYFILENVIIDLLFKLQKFIFN
jgi:hypothetical protein